MEAEQAKLVEDSRLAELDIRVPGMSQEYPNKPRQEVKRKGRRKWK